MKRKSELVNVLDQLRSQDPKKRFASVQAIKEIATAIGPARVRTQFIPFLSEFIDDEQNIVIELLTQLEDFASFLGGQQHEKVLIPLLIAFCKTDEKKQADLAVKLMKKILIKNKDMILDVVKKLNKTDMNIAKECSLFLIAELIDLQPQNQLALLQIFSGMVFNQNSSYKIIASKLIEKLLQKTKGKEQIGKMLEVIYNDNEDLPKIFALRALILYYPVNNNLCLMKLKSLLVINSWRINAKICEATNLALKVMSKPHFKAVFEAPFLKFLASSEPQLRCRSCIILKSFVQVLTEEQIKTKVMPLIKKLAQDTVDYVKIELSKNIVSLFEVLDSGFINDDIMPIIFNFIRNNELAIGIMTDFQILTKKMSPESLQEKILNPLVNQFNTQNWRIKCQIIQLMSNVITNSIFINDVLTKTLVELASDKINAVRQKAVSLIIKIINQQSPQWCDNMMIPKLTVLKQSQNYILRQNMLTIIQATYAKVSDKTLNDVYKSTLTTYLVDKVPNVRAKALKLLKDNKKLYDKMMQKSLQRLKSDGDFQVKQIAAMIKV